MNDQDLRRVELLEWLTIDLGHPVESLVPASEDASFRRYFRASTGGRNYVVMDAPPGKEDVRPYLQIARLLAATGVHVPRVHAADADRGFVLLEDLGETPYLAHLRAGGDPDALYAGALAALARIQVRGRDAAEELPPYDHAALRRELDLMPQWFLDRHLALRLAADERGVVDGRFHRAISFEG